jgi:uncharacterized protein
LVKSNERPVGSATGAADAPCRGAHLEGWLIPADASDKLIIANHPMGFSRSGMPTHLEPGKSVSAASGNDFEIDFIPDYRILHDAGYNVLAYDLRNFGHSGAANGGIASSGIFEARDVLGSLRYVRERGDARHMTVALFSRCLGCSSTFYAMSRDPRAFTDVRCFVGHPPRDDEGHHETTARAPRCASDRLDELEQLIVLRTSIGSAERVPQEWAKHVRVSTFLYQVHDDVLTDPSDV